MLQKKHGGTISIDQNPLQYAARYTYVWCNANLMLHCCVTFYHFIKKKLDLVECLQELHRLYAFVLRVCDK